jgi:C4-dicarboxylate-specific signal transduction histidine kinase
MSPLVYSIPPFLTAGLLAFLAVVAFRHAWSTLSGRLFAMLCVMSSLLYVEMVILFNAHSAAMALESDRLGHVLHPFLLPLFLHFFHVHLKIRRRPWLLGIAYGYAALLALLAPGETMIAAVHHFSFGYFGQAGSLYPLMAAGVVLVTAYNLFVIHRTIANTAGNIEKNRLMYVLVGFGTLSILSSLNMLTTFGYNLYPPGAFGFIPMTVFAVGVFKYDLLDMDLLIRRCLHYSAPAVVLVGGYALLPAALQRIFGEARFSEALLVLSALIFTIILVTERSKNWRFKIFVGFSEKNRSTYRQTIEQVSRTIAGVLDHRTITRLLQETLIDNMQVKNCSLFVADADRSGYVTRAAAGQVSDRSATAFVGAHTCLPRYLLETARPVRKQQLMGHKNAAAAAVLAEITGLHGEVILPMLYKERLNGFLVLGEHRSGRVYHHRELRLLETLCHQSAVAIENAHAYQALEELNRTLEAKVAERTEDLQAALVEKERSQEQLIRSESLAALGQLVAGVAHELNNPLASVTSILQSTVEDLRLWEPDSPPDEALMDDLLFADTELSRAKSIVASLLGLARQTQTYEELVDMNSVIRDALRILFNQYKHASVTIVEELDARLPNVSGNFANLGQVVLNIIQNAIQAVSDQTGRIVLGTRYSPVGRQVIFSCRDNGPGIDPKLRQDIFKPFFTTKPVGQGTGLGLYICHEIVRKHGGSVLVETSDERGTAMAVRLPANEVGRPQESAHDSG